MAKRGAGEGSISKRKDGKWQGAITIGRNDDGTQRRKYFYGETRNEVADEMNKAISQYNEGNFIDKNRTPRVSEWLNIWLWDYKRNSIRPTTFEQYETLIRVHAIPAFGNKNLADLKPEHLQKLYNKLHEKGTSSRTIRLVHAVMGAALKQAIRNGIINRNVCEAATPPKATDVEMRVLTRDEQKKFIDVTKDERIGCAFLFAMYTGARRGEILALKWEDFDFKGNTVSIKRTLNRVKSYNGSGGKTELVIGTPKTAKSRRVIPLADDLIYYLGLHKIKQNAEKELAGELYEDEDVVFATELGKMIEPGNFNRKFYKLVESADIPHANPHCLRHTFATRGLETGIDLKTMQEFLGHNSILLTANTYTHVLLDKKRDEIKKLNGLFS